MILALMALAATSPHPGTVYGWHHSCAEWTKTRSGSEGRWQGDEGYIVGFVSGYNVFGPGDGDIASGPNATGMLGWIDQYCTANPLDLVETAGFKLVAELQRRKAR